MSMKLFLISQNENNGYDTYDSIVVCAVDEDSARMITPSSSNFDGDCWASSPDKVKVEFIGFATEGMKEGVILASFNAG